MEDSGGNFGHSGAAGSFQQLPVHLLQLVFGLFARGDVPKDNLQSDQAFFRIAKRCFNHLDINVLAGGVSIIFDSLKWFATGENFLVILTELLGEGAREQIIIGFANDLLDRFANGPAKESVGKSKTPLEVLAKNVLRQAFYQGMIERC